MMKTYEIDYNFVPLTSNLRISAGFEQDFSQILPNGPLNPIPSDLVDLSSFQFSSRSTGFFMALGFLSVPTHMNTFAFTNRLWWEMPEDQGLAYWMRWQVVVCALIAALPSLIAMAVILKAEKQPLSAASLWTPCWKKLNPYWLLAYRGLAFLFMALLLGQMVLLRGAFNFFFYTQYHDPSHVDIGWWQPLNI